MKEKSRIIEITGVKNVCSSDTNLLRAQRMSPTILTPQINFSQGGKSLESRLTDFSQPMPTTNHYFWWFHQGKEDSHLDSNF